MSVIYRWNPGNVVLRQDEDGSETIDSMVVPFNEWIEVDSVFEGNFVERFAPGSLKKTLRENMRRIRVYFEHGFSKLYDSQPIADLQRAWEEPDAAWFTATLLDGLPDVLLSGLRRGLYGASIGAQIVKVETNENPEPSDHNPKGLEERTYTEVQAHDFSITPRPAYASTSVSLRSITDELAVEQFLQHHRGGERLLEILREIQEAEPTHLEPTAPDADGDSPPEPEQPGEPQPEADPDQPEGSRATQPPPDYLADNKEEEWLL